MKGLAQLRHIRSSSVLSAVMIVGILGTTSPRSDGIPSPLATFTATVSADTQLRRVGMTPGTLCAMGVDAATLQGIVTTAKAWTLSNENTIGNADTTIAEASTEVRRAEATTQRANTSGSRTTLQNARQSLTLAHANRGSLDDALAAAVTALLTPGQQTAFATLRDNEAADVPVEYRLVERPAEEWTRLRDALAQRRTCELEGVSLPTATADYLAMVENEATTAAALTARADLEAFELAWQTAMSP